MEVDAVLDGFPEHYLARKAQRFLETESSVKIHSFKLNGSKAEIILNDREDLSTLKNSLPVFLVFGNERYTITLSKEFPGGHTHRSRAKQSLPRRSEDQICDFSKIHTWYDMKLKPDDCKKGAFLLQNVDHGIKPKKLLQCFEPVIVEYGGYVEKMLQMIDGVLFIYQSSEQGDEGSSLVSKIKQVKVGGKTVKVVFKAIPELYKNRLVLIDIFDTEEELVMMALESCSTSSVGPKSITPCSSKVLLAEYEKNLEYEELMDIMSDIMERYATNPDSEAVMLPKTDCLRVTGVPNGLQTKGIQIIFESKNYATSGKVTRIDRLKDESVLIYFSSYKDVESMDQKYRDGGVKWKDSTMHVKPYFHCLSNSHRDVMDNQDHDKYCSIWKDHSIPPEGFLYPEVDQDVLSFLSSRPDHFSRLTNEFQGIAEVKLSNDRKAIAVKPAPNYIVTDHHEFQENARGTIQGFLKGYQSKRCDSINRGNLKKAREHKLHKQLDVKYTGEAGGDVSIRWTGSEASVVLVTGMTGQVDATVEDIMRLTDIGNETITLKKGQYRWLMDCKAIEEIKKEVKSTKYQKGNFHIQTDDDKCLVTVTGNANMIKTTHITVLKHVSDIRGEMFDSLNAEQNAFFIQAVSRLAIRMHVVKTFLDHRKQIRGTVTLEADGAYIWTEQNSITDAVIILRGALTRSTVAVPDKNALQSRSWNDLVEALEKQGMKEQVSIVGFSNCVNEAVKKTQNFIDVNSDTCYVHPTEFGTATYISLLQDFTSACGANGVSFSLDCLRGVMKIEGKKKGVDKVKALLQNTIQTILSAEHQLQNFNIRQYFSSGDGAAIISEASADGSCLILTEGNGWPGYEGGDYAGARVTAWKPQLRKSTEDRSVAKVAIGSLEVCLHLGNVMDHPCDVMVSATGQGFDLIDGIHHGGSTASVESTSAHRQKLLILDGNGLPCKKIFHLLHTGGSAKLKKCIRAILQEADQHNFASVSIPDIGAGKFRLKTRKAVKSFIRALRKFTKANPNTSVKSVTMFISDHRKIADYKKYLDSYSTVTGPPKRGQSHHRIPPSFHSMRTVDERLGLDASSTSSQGPSGLSPSSSSSVIIGPLKLTVKKGDIIKETNDVIINSCGSDFQLKNGMVSKKILEIGGGSIQAEVSKQTGKAIRISKSGQLPCKAVFHISFPHNQSEMKDCLVNILKEAESQGFTSVSMPAIGTGNLKLASDAVAKLMLEAFNQFAITHPQTKNLKVLDVVIFDTSKYSAFVDGLINPQSGAVPKTGIALRRLQKGMLRYRSIARRSVPPPQQSPVPRRHSPDTTAPTSRMLGQLTVSVRQGDITEEKNDAIVNSIGTDFCLKQGLVSQAIVRKGGDGIANELSSAGGKFLRITSGGRLQCKKILHVAFADKAQQIPGMISDVLRTAENENLTSISLPAIGTGKKGLSVSSMASTILDGINKFVSTVKSINHLRKVDIVVFQTDMVESFRQSIIGDSPARMQRVSPSNSSNSMDMDDDAYAYFSASDSDSSESDDEPLMSDSDGEVEELDAAVQSLEETRPNEPAVASQGTKQGLDPHSITFHFYYQKNYDKAWKMIQDKVKQDFDKRRILNDSIAAITDLERAELSEIAKRNTVDYTINKTQKSITVRGLRQNVTRATDSMQIVFQNLSVAESLRDAKKVSWMYCNEKGNWNTFPSRTIQDMEKVFEGKQTGVKSDVDIFFNKRKQKCKIDFDAMELIDDSGKAFKVKRSVKGEFPSNWTDMHSKQFERVGLPGRDAEYQDVEKLFTSTLPNAKINSISRIQNKKLYQRYVSQRKAVMETLKRSSVEMSLFHGTTQSELIIKNGFDRNYAGKNATAYGRGVYFAKDASYSNDPKYATPDSRKEKTMVLADVITGDYCLGNSGLLSAPSKAGTDGTEVYNCVVNNLDKPSIFVVFEDGGAYPAYLIKYRIN